MAQLSTTKIIKAIFGLFSSLDSTDEDLLKTTLWRQKVSIPVTDGGTAGTAQTETVMWRNNTGADVRVVSAHLLAPIAITAHGSNYATFTISRRTSAGASAATVADFATDTVATDDVTAFAPKALTNTVANVIVADGYVLTAKVTKTGTGVAIAAATSQAVLEVVLEPVV
jgi:hypothetical protein